ncbi:hypothetical protein HMI56_000711 [Coelomomyces lativittatus]|nr:hypothetical protein HMI56_000711 [Coelomomyces lativittatus]
MNYIPDHLGQGGRTFSSSFQWYALPNYQHGEVPPSINNRFTDPHEFEISQYRGSVLDRFSQSLLLTEVLRGMWVGKFS